MNIEEELKLLNRMKDTGRWMVFSAVGVFTGCLSFLVAYWVAPPQAFDNGSLPLGVILGMISIASSIVGLFVNNTIQRHLHRQLPHAGKIHI
jgi:hypothetical protein